MSTDYKAIAGLGLKVSRAQVRILNSLGYEENELWKEEDDDINELGRERFISGMAERYPGIPREIVMCLDLRGTAYGHTHFLFHSGAFGETEWRNQTVIYRDSVRPGWLKEVSLDPAAFIKAATELEIVRIGMGIQAKPKVHIIQDCCC